MFYGLLVHVYACFLYFSISSLSFSFYCCVKIIKQKQLKEKELIFVTVQGAVHHSREIKAVGVNSRECRCMVVHAQLTFTSLYPLFMLGVFSVNI